MSSDRTPFPPPNIHPAKWITRAHPDQRDIPQDNSGCGLLAFPHRSSVNGVPDACKVQINYQTDNNYSAFSQPINTRIRESEKLAAFPLPSILSFPQYPPYSIPSFPQHLSPYPTKPPPGHRGGRRVVSLQSRIA